MRNRLSVRLDGARFFTSPVDHQFTFSVLDDNGSQLFVVPVVTANVDGGPNAVHLRAHENLVHLLELALDAAREQFASAKASAAKTEG